MWRTIDSAPTDGTSIIIRAKGMAIEAWYCPGEWGPDIPGEVREYSGAAWIAFDDLTQFEIEEGALEDGGDHHGSVTHWMRLPKEPEELPLCNTV